MACVMLSAPPTGCFRDKSKRRREPRPPMTIVAGFPGNVPGDRFVVLAADFDEAGGLTKSSVRKIAVIDKGGCKCIIGGAGFIDLAVQHINAELQPPFSVSAVNELIEDVVTQIYADRIDTYPAHEQDDLGLIRFGGHRPRGGYDGQNGIKQGGTTGTTTVL